MKLGLVSSTFCGMGWKFSGRRRKEKSCAGSGDRLVDRSGLYPGGERVDDWAVGGVGGMGTPAASAVVTEGVVGTFDAKGLGF